MRFTSRWIPNWGSTLSQQVDAVRHDLQRDDLSLSLPRHLKEDLLEPHVHPVF